MKEIKSQSEYQEVINSGKPVLLDFYADWCGPCQSLLPTVEKLANKYKDDFIIAKINVDENRDLPELGRDFPGSDAVDSPANPAVGVIRAIRQGNHRKILRQRQ